MAELDSGYDMVPTKSELMTHLACEIVKKFTILVPTLVAGCSLGGLIAISTTAFALKEGLNYESKAQVSGFCGEVVALVFNYFKETLEIMETIDNRENKRHVFKTKVGLAKPKRTDDDTALGLLFLTYYKTRESSKSMHSLGNIGDDEELTTSSTASNGFYIISRTKKLKRTVATQEQIAALRNSTSFDEELKLDKCIPGAAAGSEAVGEINVI